MSEEIELLRQVVSQIGGGERPGQDQMVQRVYQALHNEDHLLVEAGTGTGKSFGYLVPAMLWALKTGDRVTVSTATLALQRQIMVQDAPLVAKAVAELHGKHVEVALLKGWNNYLCLRKAAEEETEDGALISRSAGKYGVTATGAEVVRLREWAEVTETGDRDDLVPGVSDRAWAQVSVSKKECLGDKCPLWANCFPAIAREKAGQADIVVTNHSLLGIAATGRAVLPETGAYILDEAHELIDRVTAQLTNSLSGAELESAAKMLRRAGIENTLSDSAAEIDDLLDAVPPGRLRQISTELNDAVARLLGAVQAAAEEAAQISEAATKQILRSRLGDLVTVCSELLSDAVAAERIVAWKTEFADGGSALYYAPLQVAATLADSLFEMRPVVLTSATLQINGSFDALAHQVGFAFPSQGPWEGIDVGTPFEPAEQGMLYVAKHLDPPGRDGYGDAALDELVELIAASHGGALCLFTARAAAERAAAYVRDRVDYPVWVQGEDQLSTLLMQFSSDLSSCLFGTISLWQGVDVPGDACRLVVIDRIPFPRPDDPLVDARNDLVRKAGGNPFMEVSVATAALLLAQGAGRLLRRRSDRGVVAVLDSRLVSRAYGQVLLRSLPRMWPTSDPVQVREALERLAQSAQLS
ncbi:MAG: ATP-dependent DNA helicase [Trueperella sp.]|nr:ATP-dependent DNA helicase [Trueperella sp.]